jgi:hypothetical protein
MRELRSDRGKSRVNRFVREVRARLGRRKHEPQQFQLELAGSILIRHSDADDEVALRRLAALDSQTLPRGSFLLAEVDGELVAAAPLDVDAELLKDPFRRTANVRELLRLQAGHVRKHRGLPARGACMIQTPGEPRETPRAPLRNMRPSAESSGTTDQGELAAECWLDG